MATISARDVDYAQLRIECVRRDVGARVFWAKVDKADYPTVSQYTWYANADGKRLTTLETYISAGGERITLSMGRLILGYSDTLGSLGRVDYRNGNPLDCRRRNLRITTQEQILAKRGPTGGRSRFKGVTWDPEQRKWLATFRGKKIGRFHDERDAARAFDEAAHAHWGDEAYLNFPPTPAPTDMTTARGRLLAFALRACLDTRAAQDDPTAYATLHAALALAEGWS